MTIIKTDEKSGVLLYQPLERERQHIIRRGDQYFSDEMIEAIRLALQLTEEKPRYARKITRVYKTPAPE